jgi:hypothetical protein
MKVCPGCRKEADPKKLKTAKEREEFMITGLCAECQEKLYGRAPGETESPRGATSTNYGPR